MGYLIDTNSLIDGSTKWYRRSVFPSVWKFLSQRDDVVMIQQVFDEVTYPSDLTIWVDQTYRGRLIKVDQDILDKYGKVQDWISMSNRWSDAGISRWDDVDKADPWLIAVAISQGHTIVTFDGAAKLSLPDVGSESGREPKISGVANQFGIRVITFYELLEELQLTL
ncbi:DUF4411 family protein [Companilactobacillus sp.]|jgi:hypothetical protein|uniref:DUF4411 family protein n=1 Tax=Companilactobacillus sp. TaxID=2767905 RepID=UPI0025BC270D|nr:DUF4411 family protein [Companilactobacillus sp.]MCH4009949.1 DUF4411 family protein [Companilactobacillus sp.]MCH4052375.1 DUF4411 family protein [Companilactobacillus sp.]MCH4077891.1 DUF4411 family protein [Companilactobacillus sp.]MCH4126467.1 DUF4411 family protein [Companilactobacillus sp.]MCH4132053.1 DUF4411 family protein [Companilactobacillus sp.]